MKWDGLHISENYNRLLFRTSWTKTCVVLVRRANKDKTLWKPYQLVTKFMTEKNVRVLYGYWEINEVIDARTSSTWTKL